MGGAFELVARTIPPIGVREVMILMLSRSAQRDAGLGCFSIKTPINVYACLLASVKGQTLRFQLLFQF